MKTTLIALILACLASTATACSSAPTGEGVDTNNETPAASPQVSYANACSATSARCSDGDEEACTLHANRCASPDSAPGTTEIHPDELPVGGMCSTKCCAACTRCVNTGECDICYRDC
jgi:hypothetical protein